MDAATEKSPSIRIYSGDNGAGSALTRGDCCTRRAMEAGGGPRLAASGGSRPPLSLGELAALDDSELGGSRRTPEHTPNVLQDLDIQDPTCSAPDHVKGKEAEGGFDGLDKELEFRLPRGHPPLLHRLGGRPARTLAAASHNKQLDEFCIELCCLPSSMPSETEESHPIVPMDKEGENKEAQKQRTARSEMWNHFEMIKVDGVVQKAKCNYCKTDITAHPIINGTRQAVAAVRRLR